MYAVVRTGGKQYRVASGDVVTVEKLDGAAAGDAVELDDVLALDLGEGLAVGTPVVEGARVVATVLEQKKTDKIVVFKKKRRKNYRRTRGHRQQVTVLRVTDILDKGREATAAGKRGAPEEADETVRPSPAATVAAVETEAPPPGEAGGAEATADGAGRAASDRVGTVAEDGGTVTDKPEPGAGSSARTETG